MNPPGEPQNFLLLDGGKYARFVAGSVLEMILVSCGRGKRGNAQFSIIGDSTLRSLAGKMREVCGLASEPACGECAAEVTPRLFVRFTPGPDRTSDALDIIEEMPGRRDRSFSVCGRTRIEGLIQFITDHLKSASGQ